MLTTKLIRILLWGLLLQGLAAAASAAVPRKTANDGQLVMQGIPPIPDSLTQALNRYQNIRAASFAAWSGDAHSIFIKTRFADVDQLHRVDSPGGARTQLTFANDPVGEVKRQPQGRLLALTRDHGGDEFDQIFLLDPEHGLLRRISDGKSLNNRMVWDRAGKHLAYRSTRRNGHSNDIWISGTGPDDEARLIFQAPDGALWKPIDFTRDGKYLLIQQFLSVADSRIYVMRLPDGKPRLLAGSATDPSTNIATGFSRDDKQVLFVSNGRNGAAEIATVTLEDPPTIRYVPSIANWDITQFVLSPDRKRGAFVTNENGISRLYLFDPGRLRYKRVDKVPVGLVGGLAFSPDNRKLGMTLNSAVSPNDAYVLTLGRRALSYKKLTRWTFSEIGGLDSSTFSRPIPVQYPAPASYDSAPGSPAATMGIPAFVYLPPGKGPFPVIIYVHGGPESQFRPGFNSEFQLWIEQLGVAVVAPNVRGSLGYGFRYMTLDNGDHREDAVRDIGALLDWIADQPQLDKTRVAVFGASYGGYMALASAVHYSDRLSAAVDRMGISNFVTFLENTQGYRRDLRRIEYGDERDPQMRAFLERVSPLNNVDEINIPLLVVQGSNDPIVPMSESEQLVKALRARGQTVWYLKALNEGHGYARKENRDLYQEATVLFLRKYLLAR